MPEIAEVLYHKIKGCSKKQIARSLNISRTTVRKYINIAVTYGYNDHITDHQLEDIAIKVEQHLYTSKTPNSFLKIKPMHSQIKGWLKDKYITHTQINRKLQDEGIIVSDRTLNRYINTYFPKLPKATIHITTIAGDEAQVDYGYVGMMNDSNGVQRKAYAFVMTLSHSRYRYVEFVFTQNQQSWAQSHINAFNFFGAIPKRILLDNLKAGVIKPDIYDPTINRTYQELSRFYGFIIDPAKSAKPEHKGKVEKSVHIVKQQLISACSYHNIQHANEAALSWCKEEISNRICSTTGYTPKELFIQEDKPAMLKIPTGVFDMPQWVEGKVHQDHHIVVNGSFYSVPTDYIGKMVSIRVGLKTIQVYFEQQLIKTHLRTFEKGKWVTDKNDYHKAAQYFLEMHPSKCIEKANEIGEATTLVIETILDSGSRGSLRKAQGVLRLVNKYGSDRLESACLRSSAFENYEYKTLKHILENSLDKVDTHTFSTKHVRASSTAYAHPANTYTSSMEANL